MGRRVLRVTPPRTVDLANVERFVTELNAQLDAVSSALDASVVDTSAFVTRGDLITRGLFPREGDALDLSQPVIARAGLLVGESSTGITASSPRTVQQIALEEAERLLSANAALFEIRQESASVGVRRALNFHAGANISLTITDDPSDDEVDVTINGIAAAGAALTKTDDTNVTLTLGGSPTTALLAATSLTLGWTGTLAAARLNSNVVQGVTNDTNVTGSISAQNLTLGWTGTLGVARGGTGANLSATGGTSQVLKQTSVGGAVTVGQLAFSDISGSVTDAQVPDTITLTNITQITNRAHASLTSLSADDHSIYALLAGRTGTTNDLVLSTSATGSLTGSAASGGGLNVKSTSHATKGQINVVDEINFRTGLTSVTGAATDTFMAHGNLASVTVDNNTAELCGFAMTGTLIQNVVPLTSVHALFGAGTPLTALTYQNASGVASFATLAALANYTTFKAITTNVTGGNLVTGVFATPTLTRDGSTTMAGISLRCIQDVPTINTGCTVDTRRVVWMQNRSGSGTQTNAIGLDVDDQTVGTLAAAVRSAISAASGKWHLYCSGTASSHLNGNLLVGTATDFASGTTHCKVAGGLSVGGDNSGVASHTSLTGTSDLTTNSTGVGTILFKGATNRNSSGFIKIYIGTTAYYVPVFSAITG